MMLRSLPEVVRGSKYDKTSACETWLWFALAVKEQGCQAAARNTQKRLQQPKESTSPGEAHKMPRRALRNLRNTLSYGKLVPQVVIVSQSRRLAREPSSRAAEPRNRAGEPRSTAGEPRNRGGEPRSTAGELRNKSRMDGFWITTGCALLLSSWFSCCAPGLPFCCCSALLKCSWCLPLYSWTLLQSS